MKPGSMTSQQDRIKGMQVFLIDTCTHVSVNGTFGCVRISLTYTTCVLTYTHCPPPPSLHPVRDGDVLVLRRRDQDPVLLPASNPSERDLFG